MKQFLCLKQSRAEKRSAARRREEAAGFKIFVKLCAPLKMPDMGVGRGRMRWGGGSGSIHTLRVALISLAAAEAAAEAEASRREFAEFSTLPTRNLLNYL